MGWPYSRTGARQMGYRTPRLCMFLAVALRLPLMAFVIINLTVSLVLLAIFKLMAASFSLTTWGLGRLFRLRQSGIAYVGPFRFWSWRLPRSAEVGFASSRSGAGWKLRSWKRANKLLPCREEKL